LDWPPQAESSSNPTDHSAADQVALDAANEAFNASAGRLRKLYAVRISV